MSTELRVRDWAYLAEGGANIVLSYVGPRPSPFSGHCLRIRKAAFDTDHEQAEQWSHQIIAPLLGAEFTPDVETLSASEDFLVALDEHIAPARPDWRKEGGHVDAKRGSVLLTEDFTAVPEGAPLDQKVMTIEIKPKWGFLPSPTHLSSATSPTKSTICRFCLHAAYKASLSTTPEATIAESYCPMDLYAHDEARLRVGLDALVEGREVTRGGANNLRVFVNGKKLLPGVEEDEATLSAFLATLGGKSLQGLLLPIIQGSTLLSNVAHLQSSLDPLDIEGLEALIRSETGQDVDSFSKAAQQPNMDDWTAWLKRWESTAAPDLHDYVLAYLLSATFKDCSILIRIPEQGQAGMKAIDLDPKPISRIGKWAKLDREIVKFALGVGDPRKLKPIRGCTL